MADIRIHFQTAGTHYTIRPLQPTSSDVGQYKALCLDNLKRKPSLFWVTYKEAKHRTETEWRRCCEQFTREQSAFGAFRGHKLIGSLEVFSIGSDDRVHWQQWLQEGGLAVQAKDVAMLGRLYTEAELGRESFIAIAAHLLDCGVAWAAQEGFAAAVGAARTSNRSAIRAFEECGFEYLRPEHIGKWPSTGKPADQVWRIKSTAASPLARLQA
jgi:hypothetical protein